MTTKDLEKFFKRANKVIDNYEGKLKILDYDYFIISNVIFTSDVDYYYLFSIFKDNKVIEKIPIYDASEYDKTFKELALKYKTNVIYNYKDLSYKQLKYLESVDDDNISQEEVSDIIFDIDMHPFR
jgi:hypothetical protein